MKLISSNLAIREETGSPARPIGPKMGHASRQARPEGEHVHVDRAPQSWKKLEAAGWSVLTHFERGGRRYVIAMEKERLVMPSVHLSDRERQVVSSASQGRSNKEIAHALGLAHSTVRVLLTRASKKLGVSTRAQLVDRFEALGRAANQREG